MKAATAAACTGICALAVLSAAQWVRDRRVSEPQMAVLLLGVLPSFAAAIAVPYVALGVLTEMQTGSSPAIERRRFAQLNGVSLLGLLAWECTQTTSTSLHFDPHDLAATVAGALLGQLIALWLFSSNQT